MKPAKNNKVSKDLGELQSTLTELARLYTFRNRESICREDLSISQCYALYALSSTGPLSLNELASYLNLEKSSASRLAHNLLEGGFIKRTSDPDDWRKISLQITKRGSAVVARIVDDGIKEVSEVFSGFNASERTAALEILSRIVHMVASRRGGKFLTTPVTSK